jgi:hypothetical protein
MPGLEEERDDVPAGESVENDKARRNSSSVRVPSRSAIDGEWLYDQPPFATVRWIDVYNVPGDRVYDVQFGMIPREMVARWRLSMTNADADRKKLLAKPQRLPPVRVASGKRRVVLSLIVRGHS